MDFDDDELTALALAAGDDMSVFDAVFDDDAVPFGGCPDDIGALLPAWYMPVPAGVSSHHRRRKAIVVGTLVASMIIVNGFGLCVTYGMPEVGDRILPF